MSLLREIQELAVSSDSRITDLLRKCKILAARLSNKDFDEWIDCELQGYKSKDDLPSYRILEKLEIKGHFSGAFGSGLRNASVLPSAFSDEFEEYVSSEYLIRGISSYEQLLDSDEGGCLQVSIPTELVAHYGDRMYENMSCMQAWKVVPRGLIVGLIDSVRNSVLSFVLEIEKINPDAGEAPINTEPVSQSNVSQIFNTYIQGDVGAYTHSSGDNATLQLDIIDIKGDFNKLSSSLSDIGIDGEEINRLEKALAEDENKNSGEVGEQTSSWMASVFSKASRGLYDVTFATATQIIPKLISEYLGMIS